MGVTPPVLLPRLDVLAPEVHADPYPAYARLRAAGPLCRMGPGTFGVTRHADVAALLRDRRLGSEFPAAYHRRSVGDGAAGEFLGRIVLYRDPPPHTRLRRLLGAAFSPGIVQGLRARVTALVDELLAPGRDTGRFDAVAALAQPLPVLVVCELMGIPADHRAEVRPHAADLGRAFGAVVPPADRAAADAAVGWLRGYLHALLAERRRRPGTDLLSRLLAAEEGGATLSPEEIVDNAVFAFFAGFETTVHLLAAGTAALLAHPAQQALLRADPGLVPVAVEEFLRYDPPIQGVARLVREPVRLGDRTLRPGRVAVLLLGSANHDEAIFAAPDRLDIGRRPNPHLSFGGGAHLCLGAALARLEGAVVFGRLLADFRALEPAGPTVRRHSGAFRTYASVPVAARGR
jgi:cytochrome P450